MSLFKHLRGGLIIHEPPKNALDPSSVANYLTHANHPLVWQRAEIIRIINLLWSAYKRSVQSPRNHKIEVARSQELRSLLYVAINRHLRHETPYVAEDLEPFRSLSQLSPVLVYNANVSFFINAQESAATGFMPQRALTGTVVHYLANINDLFAQWSGDPDAGEEAIWVFDKQQMHMIERLRAVLFFAMDDPIYWDDSIEYWMAAIKYDGRRDRELLERCLRILRKTTAPEHLTIEVGPKLIDPFDKRILIDDCYNLAWHRNERLSTNPFARSPWS